MIAWLVRSLEATAKRPCRGRGDRLLPAVAGSARRRMVPGAGIEPAWSCPRGIFLPTTAFAAATSAFGVWTFSLPCRLGRFRQEPSSLYTFHGCLFRRPGLARDCHYLSLPATGVEVSPNLTPFTTTVSRRVLNILSPLRLPISPPGLRMMNTHCNALPGLM